MANHLQLGLIGLDFPELDIFAAAEEYGIEFVELYLERNVGDLAPDQLRAHARAAGARIVSISSLALLNRDGDEYAHDARLVERSIRLAAEVGAPFATFMYGGSAELTRAAARRRALNRVEPLLSLAAMHGVTLLIENVFSRVPPGDMDDPELAAEFFDAVDSAHLGLNFDPANFAIGGKEAFPYAYQLLRPHIRYMHFKDATLHRPEWHGELGERRPLLDHERGMHISVPLGEGSLNYDALVRQVVADGYAGVVSLEPFGRGEHCRSWLKSSLRFLEERGVRRPSSEQRGNRC